MAQYQKHQRTRRRSPVVLRVLLQVLGGLAIFAMAGLVYWVLKPTPPVSDYQLLGCLPPAAEVAVFQRSLETDWLRLRTSKWFQVMMSRPELKEFAHKHGFDKNEPGDAERWVLDVIGGRVLVGYVPDPQKPGKHNIFAFAPVGNRAQRLELWAQVLQHGGRSGFALTSTRHGEAEVVRVTVKDWPENLVLKYTKFRGIIMAVLSETEDTLERYLDREAPKAPGWNEQPKPLQGMAADFLREFAEQMDDESYRSQRGLCRLRNGLFAWSIDTTNLGTILVNTHAPLLSPPPLKAPANVTSSSLVKQLPAGPMLTISGRLSEWWAVVAAHVGFFAPADGQAVEKSLVQFRDTTPWIGDHFAIASLRWQPITSNLPVPVPQWAAAVECYNEKQARSGIQDALQGLNSRFETQWALAPADAAGIIVDRLTAGDGAFARQITRWPAMKFSEGVLLAASDMDSLVPMLTPKPWGDQSGDENRLRWQVTATTQAVRGALDAYAFYRLFSKNRPPPAVELWLPRVQMALDALSALSTVNGTCKIENSTAYFSAQAVYNELAPQRASSSNN
jgi:hypothetical protein